MRAVFAAIDVSVCCVIRLVYATQCVDSKRWRPDITCIFGSAVFSCAERHRSQEGGRAVAQSFCGPVWLDLGRTHGTV